jgi:Arc/MetJ family transcription regulator
MATNLSIDPELIERALKVSGERTKKAAVTKALQEFIARRQQKGLIDLMGRLDWDAGFDYKAERKRDRACSSTPAYGRWRCDAPPASASAARADR